jgi:serine/threonine-protein kinase HipA
MKVGGEYRLKYITAQNWRRFARNLRVDDEQLFARLIHLGELIPDTLAGVCKDEDVLAVASDLPTRLLDAVVQRTASCLVELRTPTT